MKFDFTQEQIEKWKDQPIFLKGKKKMAVVLLHGWTAMPKQLRLLAENINRSGYWVSVPMLSGHGTKPEDMERFGARDWIRDAEEAVKIVKDMPGIEKVVVGGSSMGGNLALLVSQTKKIDGVILIGTPVHLKNHFWIWIGSRIVPLFKKYFKKKYPQKVQKEKAALEVTSYQYFPVSSVKESLDVIRKSVFSLGKVKVPILIIQTNSDYLVAKYSPWIIYNSVGSKKKKLQWIKSKNNSHVMISERTPDFFSSINNFLREVEVL